MLAASLTYFFILFLGGALVASRDDGEPLPVWRTILAAILMVAGAAVLILEYIHIMSLQYIHILDQVGWVVALPASLLGFSVALLFVYYAVLKPAADEQRLLLDEDWGGS